MTKILSLITILLFFISPLSAQEQEDPLPIILNEQSERALDWVPTLLNANNSSLYNSVIFNGRIFGWYLRGENNSLSVIDGIQYTSPLNKWRFWDLISGLQGQFQKTTLSINGAFTDQGHNQSTIVNYLSSSPQEGIKNLNIGSSVSNSIFANSFNARITSPNIRKGWRSSLGIVFQHMPSLMTTASYKESVGIVYGMEKRVSLKNNLGFTVVWNYSDQSKVATSVKEAFDLAKNNTYNPTWGWLQLKPYFPNTKQSNAPIISFRYQHNYNENHYYKFSQSIIIGRQSASSLEWTQTADPRPDYYRYLPSYLSDASLKINLANWYAQHPESLQINFDRILQINKSSIDRRSFYIVNQQNSDLYLWNGSFLYSKYYGNDFNLSWGANYLYHHISYSNKVKDLLGGSYFLNYNNWINDDGLNASFQNDILRPDRKISASEKWGPNYAMNAAQIYPWIQINKNYAKFEAVFGMGYGVKTLFRHGYNTNGLFPLSSFGKSNNIWSDAKDFKVQLLYKFSGRLYFRSIVFAKWELPVIQDIFIDPTYNSVTSPYLKTVFNHGADLSIYYRAPNIKLFMSVYVNNSFNNSTSKMFYHDHFASFIYGLVGNINKSNSGFEFSAEMPILQKIQMTFVSTVQKNIFLNNPQFQLLSVNDLQSFSNGTLHLQNLAAESSPSFANAMTFQYQPIATLRIGITMLYVTQRPIAVDFYRRTDDVKNKLDIFSWTKIQETGFLPDNGILNMYMSKSLQIKIATKTLRFFTNLSIRNVLNTFIPVFAYEQSRFDYVKFNSNKYPVKYLLDQGITYSLRIQLQIQ